MKPYGKASTYVFGCKCCSMSIAPRQEAKRELAKLIEEELHDQYVINGQIVSDPRIFVCGVCGKPDNPDCAYEC
jgi:hypothetical protein